MDAVLPEDRADARLLNAGLMELGALVCTARSPRCDACPISERCSWRAGGYPPFEGRRTPVQKRFQGSDRQVRGLIMAELRASDVPVSAREIETVWRDAAQRDRALTGLVADGLVVARDGGLELPG